MKPKNIAMPGSDNMFDDMFNSMDQDNQPLESFYDGYVVNAIMDACYKSAGSKKWEPVELDIWRGKTKVEQVASFRDYDKDYYLVKEEKLPDRKKLILKNKKTGKIIQREV